MLINGDALHIPLANESVQCVVTSPPYLRQRDYGVAGQIGQEESLEEYVAKLAAVFREVWRVLRRDGTLWLVLGDGYVTRSGGGRGEKQWAGGGEKPHREGADTRERGTGLAEKNLMLLPARVALALQADGWVVRSDVVWWKTNAIPENIRDRPTRSHEFVFLLSKRGRYYYDAEAIREPAVVGDTTRPRGSAGAAGPPQGGRRKQDEVGDRRYTGVNGRWEASGPHEWRNKRDVWRIPTRPIREAHYATYPEELVEPCILAGSRPGDVVLDPFVGSGTTVRAAGRLGRVGVGVDLSLSYLHDIARRRVVVQRPLVFDAGCAAAVKQQAGEDREGGVWG